MGYARRRCASRGQRLRRGRRAQTLLEPAGARSRARSDIRGAWSDRGGERRTRLAGIRAIVARYRRPAVLDLVAELSNIDDAGQRPVGDSMVTFRSSGNTPLVVMNPHHVAAFLRHAILRVLLSLRPRTEA